MWDAGTEWGEADGADDGRGLGPTLAGDSPAVSEVEFEAGQNNVGVADPLQSRDVAIRAQGNVLHRAGRVETHIRSISQAMDSGNPPWREEIGRGGRKTVGAALVSEDAASQEEMEKQAVWDLGKPTHALAKMMRFADVLYNDLHLPTPKGCKSSLESVKWDEREAADVREVSVHGVELELRHEALLDARFLQRKSALPHPTAL